MKKAIQKKSRTSGSMKITAIFMIFVVLFFILVSTFFIAYEADHECTGEDCPVCTLIHISENGLRQLGNGAPAAAAVCALMILIAAMRICIDDGIALSTPVSRKTRLNN